MDMYWMPILLSDDNLLILAQVMVILVKVNYKYC